MPGHVMLATEIDHVICGAIFNGDEPRSKHRFALWRIFDTALPPLVVIGLNPSVATHLVADPTVRRCLGFARAWGYGGLVMLNLFSFRATNPKYLEFNNRPHGIGPSWPEYVTGGEANDAYLKFFATPPRAGLVLAAWGNHGWIAGRCAIVEDMLCREGVELHALGVTKQFRPLHPLYTPKHLTAQLYRAGRLHAALAEALEEPTLP